MKTSVGIALAIVFALAANSSAQDVGLFNGNGINNPFGNPQSSAGSDAKNVLGANRSSSAFDESRWKLPKFDFSKLKPNLQLPKFLQGDGYPKPLEFSDTQDGLFSIPKLEWPTRDPSQPNFFQRMNERTRDIFGKTRDSFSNLTDRSRNTWDSITRGVTSELEGFGSSLTTPPAQPKLRAARTADGSTSKF